MLNLRLKSSQRWQESSKTDESDRWEDQLASLKDARDKISRFHLSNTSSISTVNEILSWNIKKLLAPQRQDDWSLTHLIFNRFKPLSLRFCSTCQVLHHVGSSCAERSPRNAICTASLLPLLRNRRCNWESVLSTKNKTRRQLPPWQHPIVLSITDKSYKEIKECSIDKKKEKNKKIPKLESWFIKPLPLCYSLSTLTTVVSS